MSEVEFIFRSINNHQVLIIVVDTRILACVADSFQERRFASISPTNYKDTKMSIFRSEVIEIFVAHGRCRSRCVGTLQGKCHAPATNQQTIKVTSRSIADFNLNVYWLNSVTRPSVRRGNFEDNRAERAEEGLYK